ncbi:MAG: sulfurtransferase-like selenium metabolism protein YedF [Pseudomonadota bacterium]
MKKEIDARGLSCPAPVLQTKAAVETEGVKEIVVIVDNEAARQNVSRFLENQGFKTSVKQKDQDFIIAGACEEKLLPKKDKQSGSSEKKIMVMVATDRMGYGDDELGKKLIVNFIKTLKEMGKELWRLVFVNNGVKLTTEGSAALKALKELEESGITILVCGTCLDHFKLLEKKKVGETTNMLDIVTAMQVADKVINI